MGPVDTETPTLPKLPARPPLVDDVYESLKAWIMDQVREPGVRANVDALARSLDVSPTPVREALVRLEAEGFVEKEPQRGWSVTPPLDAARIADLYELRLRLEPWASGRAATRATPAGRDRLHAELASCAHAPTGDDYAAYRALVQHDERFHDLLLELAGNEEVRTAFARTNCHLHIFRVTYGGGMGEQALEEHAAIVAAIDAGDAVAAEAAMQRHLEQARDRIEATLSDD